jgi:hypothetical protein
MYVITAFFTSNRFAELSRRLVLWRATGICHLLLPSMYKFNLIGGLLLIVLCCAVLPGKLAEREVAGELVLVQVIQENCNASAAFRFMHFRFHGQQYSLKTDPASCQLLQVGQPTLLRHLDTHPGVFLLPGSYSSGECFTWGALFLFGGYAILNSVRHLRRRPT